jgi:hypothetical protein
MELSSGARMLIDIAEGDMQQLTVAELRAKYNYSEMLIRKYMQRRNITPVSGRKSSFNINFFRSMTPELAYVLGWIASDGCVGKNKVTISLQVGDKAILESLKVLVEYTGEVKETSQDDTRTLKTNHHAVLTLYSKTLVEILATYGLGRRKSLTLEYPDLPDDMQAHFVRGFFDGDGCINKMSGARTNYRISYCGPQPFLQSLRAVVNAQNDLKTGSITEQGQIASLAYNGRHSAIRVLRWMYEPSRPETRLERKYAKYLLALEDGENRDSMREQVFFETSRARIIEMGNSGKQIKQSTIEKYGLSLDKESKAWS